MGLIREPKNVDFSMKSEPWNEKDLAEFRVLMNELKAKKAKRLVKKRSEKVKKKHAKAMA